MNTVRQWCKHAALGAFGVLDAWLGSRARGAFGILMYHRIAPPTPGTSPPTWSVTPERFRAQLAGLIARGYEPWPLRQALARHRGQRPVPRRAFVVTFDDGYENVYSHALPVLEELSCPASVFLVTSYLDAQTPLPFDDWPEAGSPAVPADAWRPLSTRQCAEMLAGGLIDLGSHTHTHADFRGRAGAFLADIARSLECLAGRFGIAEAAFSYPFGHHDAGLVAAARESGVLCGLTASSGLVAPRSNLFACGRFTVDARDTAVTLAAKLGGWSRLVRDAGHRRQAPADAPGRSGAALGAGQGRAIR